MKTVWKAAAMVLLGFFVFEVSGCKTISKALGIPYGQVQKATK